MERGMEGDGEIWRGGGRETVRIIGNPSYI